MEFDFNLTNLIATFLAIFLSWLIIEIRKWITTRINKDEFDLVVSIAREVVMYVEQRGFSGKAAFEEAKRQITTLARERGLKVDIDRVVEVLIEAGVWDEFKRPVFGEQNSMVESQSLDDVVELG